MSAINHLTSTPPVAARSHKRGVVIVALIACAIFAGWAKGRGYKTSLFRVVYPQYGRSLSGRHPSIVKTRPGDQDANVLPASVFIAADVDMPNNGQVVDGASLDSDSVRLYRTNDHHAVSAIVNTSGAGDAIVLRPVEPLDSGTQYTFEVTDRAKDTGGHSFTPYSATFWTAAVQSYSDFPAAFERVPLPAAGSHMFTCVAMGPDHRLYASTLSGEIFRYAISADGTLSDAQLINTVNEHNGASRLITGFTFDPSATASNLMIWVCHGSLPDQGERGQAWIRGAADWTGKLSRLEGDRLERYEDVLVGLPRGWKDHLNNQPVFGPDGALYFCQASNTAMGAPDHKWGFRPERLLTSAILRVDVAALAHRDHPLDVKTEEGGAYDPFAPGAPVTLYATGIRNSFDLVWHSNGHLYAGVNGSAAGGNAPGSPDSGVEALRRIDVAQRGAYAGPAVPPLNNVVETEDDMLFRVEPGAYYGHPNPVRAEYVLNGGHVAPHANPYVVWEYPMGTQPDRNWRPPIFSFGKNLSPCGGIEYRSGIFNGALRGMLLFVRYSGGDDIQALALDGHGNVRQSLTGIEGFGRFVNPVDLTEDPATGSIYVAEFGGKRLTLVRPLGGNSTLAAVSHHVCRQQVSGPVEVVSRP